MYKCYKSSENSNNLHFFDSQGLKKINYAEYTIINWINTQYVSIFGHIFIV